MCSNLEKSPEFFISLFLEVVLKDEVRSTAALVSGQSDESDPQDPNGKHI